MIFFKIIGSKLFPRIVGLFALLSFMLTFIIPQDKKSISLLIGICLIIVTITLYVITIVKKRKKEAAVIMIKTLNGSDYDFLSLLERAKSEIFVVGRTINFLVKKEIEGKRNTIKEKIFSKMTEKKAKNESFKVRLMLCNPDCTEFVEAWRMINPEFKEELEDSVKIYREWQLEAIEKELRLEIRLTPVVPLSLTGIDPDTKNSVLVISPSSFSHNDKLRSAFCVTNNKDITALTYLDDYSAKWRKAVPILEWQKK